MKLFTSNKTYNEFQFEKEADFEKEVVLNSKQFFGTNSIYIDAKRKIETKNLGNSIPDGFLFDLSDKNNPEFYIVEVELAKHDFYNHIFPQITKFFGFYKNHKGQNDLVEKIFSFVNDDNELKKEFKKYLGEKEIYKFIKDTLVSSQNFLLVIDGDKKELPEIMETYSETWGKMVKLVLLKKFFSNNDVIYTMHPDFENIEFAEIENEISTGREDVEYNEDYHFDGVLEAVRKIYTELKESLVKEYPNLLFNPQKYYISIRKERSIAFFIIGRKKIRLVVMESDEVTRKEITQHPVKTLTASVQKFWNGPSCAIIIEKDENLNEIQNFLKRLVAKY
jgi:predicted transport protein